MGTIELVELIDKLPAEKKKEVEDFVVFLFSKMNADSQKGINVHIKRGLGGGKGIFGEIGDDFDKPLDEMKQYR